MPLSLSILYVTVYFSVFLSVCSSVRSHLHLRLITHYSPTGPGTRHLLCLHSRFSLATPLTIITPFLNAMSSFFTDFAFVNGCYSTRLQSERTAGQCSGGQSVSVDRSVFPVPHPCLRNRPYTRDKALLEYHRIFFLRVESGPSSVLSPRELSGDIRGACVHPAGTLRSTLLHRPGVHVLGTHAC